MKRLTRHPELVTVALIVLAFVAGAMESHSFLDPIYLLDRTKLFAETGLMVIGMTFVIVCGQIDLSVAANLGLTACLVAKLALVAPPPVVVLAGVLIGGLLGAFNGVLIAYANLPSFLVTLGTLAFYRGAAQALVGSESVALPAGMKGIGDAYLPYPAPISLVIVLVVGVGLGIVLHRSMFGRWVYATGANEQAANYSAVPAARVKFWVFVLSGVLAGIGAVLMDSRLGVARYDHAKGFELDVITATVLGGASIYGGKGSMLGAILAFFLIFLVRTGMGLANVSAEYQLAVVGTLLIVAVGLNMLAGRRGS
ncbi:MAG TPA: ABC transporter permease [Fimbriimonadaceae bacterium]|nr:ABC transporter permease [Fimbriimonadaceae bacterium]